MKHSTFFLVHFILIMIHLPGNAQDNPARIFSSPRMGLTHSADLPYAGELHFIIHHRFGELSEGFYDLFGLDLATIRLGFDYGITDDFTAGFGRSTFEKTYDIFLKGAFLRQSQGNFPLTLTGVLSASVNTLRDFYPADENNLWGRTSLSGQLIAGRKTGIFSLQAGPVVMRNNHELRSDGDLTLFALQLGASIELAKRFAFTTQYIPVFDKPDFAGENPFSAGFDITTRNHQFQLIFSNNRGTFDKSVLTNTEGEWGSGKIYFGFNLVREFELVRSY